LEGREKRDESAIQWIIGGAPSSTIRKKQE